MSRTGTRQAPALEHEPTPVSRATAGRERTTGHGSGSGSGEPLAPSLRQRFEPLFGADFSQVRVHVDAASERATRALDADAFAAGEHIHFGADRWQPAMAHGSDLLAHELAHVVQQRAGAAGGATASASSMEREADAAGAAAAAGSRVDVSPRHNAPLVQRKPRHYNEKFDQGHDRVVKAPDKFKALYVQWRTDLTDAIVAHCGAATTPHDYRFVLMLAQRMVEQDGPRAVAQGNNPYNVMGQGDEGQFFRPKNQEGPAGAKRDVPAHFAAFSSEGMANDAYLDMLADRWPKAFAAIAAGASTQSFVEGLYPGHQKDYATAAKQDYIGGVRLRARSVVGDLRQIYTTYLADYENRVLLDETAAFTGTAPENADLNQLAVALLRQELLELDDLSDRIIGNQPVNRPAAAEAP